MADVLAKGVGSFMSVKLKVRHDSFTDQVQRIWMTKVFVVSSIIMFSSRFYDQGMGCIVPESVKLPNDFVQNGCWIRGFYIYPYLADHMDQSAYYGIPNELRYTGYSRNDPSSLCVAPRGRQRRGSTSVHESCIPMQKEYFKQFQWMPYCIFVMAFLFYLPYILFRYTITDIVSLRQNLKSPEINADDYICYYFDHRNNSITKQRIRIFFSYAVKILYIIVNMTIFYILDWSTNYRFKSYGNDWFEFSRLDDAMKHDFDWRSEPTPGNRFLPTFALCDLSAVHSKTFSVRSTVVCEVSSFLYFQYIFLLLWLFVIMGMCLSALGFIFHMGYHMFLYWTMKHSRSSNLYNQLTLREMEYLECLRLNDLVLHSRVLKTLIRERVRRSDTSLLVTRDGEHDTIC
ncbi:innexin inx2-like [Clytia hemisphaerica]|uniref:Innexin n=1 Tax=Clytia hemisphaerica TaxID=252671 RepID=A0A7M5XHJ6_9CNID